MKVAYIYADSATEWNCSEWRQLAPCDAMNRISQETGANWHGKMIHYSGFLDYLNPAIQDWIMPADIVVYQRNFIGQEVMDAINYWKGLGKIIAADLDDAYQILPWSNPAHKFWVENHDGKMLEWLEHGLSLCDGLTSPNQLILNDWAHVVKGWKIQNYARREWWTGLKEREEIKAMWELTDRIVIGWGGSVSHYDSWWGSGLRDAIVAVTKRFPQVMWMVCGNDPRLADQLDIPTDNKVNHPGVMPNLWPQVVKGFDIGLAPLHGIYDQHRSWIKGLEYMLAGVPWIGTTGVVYDEMKQYGRLVPNVSKMWELALTNMIMDLQNQQALSKSRISIAQGWFIDQQLGTYERVYNDIIKHAQGKRGRLPEVHYVNWGSEPGFSANFTPTVQRRVEWEHRNGAGGQRSASLKLRDDSALEQRVHEGAE